MSNRKSQHAMTTGVAAQLAVMPPTPSGATNGANQGAGANGHFSPRFINEESAGVGDGSVAMDAGLSKRRKAQRYRDLTCPRVRTSALADGTKIVTVGSHVLVYPADKSAVKVVEGAKAHPTNKNAAQGAVTTFEPHPIWTFPDDSFKHYSLGVGLYFKSARQLAWIFFIISVVALPSIILALISNPHDSDSGLYFEKTSVGNFGSLSNTNTTELGIMDDEDYVESKWGLPQSLTKERLVLILSCLDVFGCLILLGFGAWLSHRQETEAKAYSKREITVKKYTVEVGNLPKTFHDRFKLAMWFQERFGPVVDCAIAFDQHDLLDVYRARGILRKDIDMAVSHGEDARLDHLYEQLGKIDARIAEIQQDLGHRRTLGAYITFEHQESRIACEKAFSNYFLKSLAKKLHHQRESGQAPSPSNAAAAALHADPTKTLLFGKSQRVLEVRQAPEPSNILFKNLKYTKSNKMARRITTFIATAVLILVSIIAVYLAQKYQGEIPGSASGECVVNYSESEIKSEEDGSTRDHMVDCWCSSLGTARALNSKDKYGIDCSSWLTRYAIARAFSVLAVLTIVVVNFILKSVIKTLTRFEKHHSLTRQQESITNKLFVGLFLNTAIVLLVVNMQFQSPDSDGNSSSAGVGGIEIAFSGKFSDFTYDWFVHVGSSIMLTMILNTMNPHLLPLMKVPYSACRRETCCIPQRHESQSKWNQRYSGEDFDLSERYAVMLNTLFVTLLYSGGMPLLLPIAAFTFMLTYIFDKVSFLRLYRIPPRFDHSLAMYTTTLLPYAIFLHLAFTMWFFSSPVLMTNVVLDSSGSVDTDSTISDYASQTFVDRISHWSTLPVLILLILVTVWIIVFRFLLGLYRTCKDIDTYADLNIDASKFVPYSVARRTVTLETYHPHGSPYYHDAFIRTPSRKMLKIPTPMAVLQEQAKAWALKRQQDQVEKAAYQGQGNNIQVKQSKPDVWTNPAVHVDEEEEEERPGMKRAESMGIQQPAQTDLADLTKQKEAAKNAARVASASKQRPAAAAAATPVPVKPRHASSGSTSSNAAAAVAAQQSNELPPSGVIRPDGSSSDLVAKPKPTKKVTKKVSVVSEEEPNAIVVMDLPDQTAEHVQADVELALGSPGVDASPLGEEDVKLSSGEDIHRFESPAPAPFRSHLQHHAHISLPTEDPLLGEVKTQLHRMSSAMHHRSADESLGPGEVNRASKKSASSRAASNKKKSKPASVHDSSSVPTLGDSIAIDVNLPSAVPQQPIAGEVSRADFDTPPSTNEAAQLVPMQCPNLECGRILELVDTGAPQMYHCPFCSTAFIM